MSEADEAVAETMVVIEDAVVGDVEAGVGEGAEVEELLEELPAADYISNENQD